MWRKTESQRGVTIVESLAPLDVAQFSAMAAMKDPSLVFGAYSIVEFPLGYRAASLQVVPHLDSRIWVSAPLVSIS